MTTIQRTGKPLKLLRAVGHLSLYVGAAAYVLANEAFGLVLVAGGLTILGVARLLVWWFHA
jgi:NaMN:DMB phosphoribosyltransferase